MAGGGRIHACEQEQAHLDRLYRRLRQLRRDAIARRDESRFESDGTPSGRFTRDALQWRYSQEIALLDAADVKLCFGRLYSADGASRHIGRMGLTEAGINREQILVDWRAPAAAPFYTATAINPQDVVRRRHIRTKRQLVTGVSDEVLQGVPTAADVGGEQAELGAADDSALLEALNAPRTGRMHDIIATIQTEQDAIIRSDRSGVLVVHGGPGTGKTVVALHRAAYLLYTHRERLGNHGVLVIGPNETFLGYISQVLPSLGESSVVLATVGTLFPGVTARAADLPEVSEIKGRTSFAKVIDAAILDRQRMPKGSRTVHFDRQALTLTEQDYQRAQRRAWNSRLPHNRARAVFVRALMETLARQLRDAADEKNRPDVADIRADLAADPAVLGAIDDLWPALSPQQLIADLFSDADRLAFAAPKLKAAQRDLLLRSASAAWTVSDAPLLDEAAELLGEISNSDRLRAAARAAELAFAQQSLDAMTEAMAGQEDAGIGYTTLGMVTADHLADRHERPTYADNTADRAAADREWTYGHVIVDEAQELSPMAWRMVMRRVPNKSMTIVGDVAQTSDPAGAANWANVLGPYVQDRWRLSELTVNYRTPEEIMAVAAPLLAQLDPTQQVPVSVRRSGFAPFARRVDELGPALAELAAQEVAHFAEGQLAILVPDALRANLLAAVRARVPDATDTPGPGSRVTVLGVRQAKGLEFDAVLVAEPAALLAQSKRGLGDLYVAVTRATQRLGVLHTGGLPPVLAGTFTTLDAR